MNSSTSVVVPVPDNSDSSAPDSSVSVPDSSVPLMPPPPPPSLDLLLIFTELTRLENIISNVNELVSLNIDNNSIEFIQMVIEKSPDTFKSISSKMSAILQDGVLNSDDVPLLINIIKDVMNIDHKKMARNMMTVENVLKFVKSMIEILIVKDHIKVDDKDKIFKLMDISFTLLTTSIDTSETITDCIKRLFKCG